MDEVVIESRLDPSGARRGADDLLNMFQDVKSQIESLEESSKPTTSLSGMEFAFTGIASAAATATIAVAAFVSATVAGLWECISTAIELEEKWANFDKENRFSTVMGDFNEAYDDLKASIGDEFLPGLKDAIRGLTFLVDATKELKDSPLFDATMQATGFTGGTSMGGAMFGAAGVAFSAVSSFGDNKSAAQLEREARRAEEEEVARIQSELRDAAELGLEREREAKRQEREEEQLAAQNRRDLEAADRAAARKEAEELHEMERTVANNRGFSSGRGKFGGGIFNFGGGEGFASAIESFDQVFNRIQTAAASERPEDKIVRVIEDEGQQAAQRHEEMKIKQDQSIEALDRAATALEKLETGLG